MYSSSPNVVMMSTCTPARAGSRAIISADCATAATMGQLATHKDKAKSRSMRLTAHTEVLVEVKPQALDLYRAGEAKLHAGQFAEGLALLRRAGDLGDAQAMLALGEIYSQDGEGHIYDEKEAMRWYRKAAEAGNREGMLNVGGFYDAGIGVPESDELAVEWYRKASKLGSPQATYDLARKYESGRGVPRDLAKACELYQRAARMGYAEADSRLAHAGCK